MNESKASESSDNSKESMTPRSGSDDACEQIPQPTSKP